MIKRACRYIIFFLILMTSSVQGKVKILQEGHRNIVHSVVFTPDGKYILSGSYGEPMRKWSLDGKSVRKYFGRTPAIIHLQFTSNGKSLLVNAAYSYLRVVNPENGKNIIHVYDKHIDFSVAAVHPSGTHILAGGRDGRIRKYNSIGKIVREVKAHGAKINYVIYKDDGKIIYSSDVKGMLKIWTSSFKLIKEIRGDEKGISAIAVNREGSIIATASVKNTVKLWNIRGKGIKSKLLQTGSYKNNKAYRLAFSPDGAVLAGAFADGYIYLWNSEGELLRKWRGHSRVASSIAWSPDGTKIVSGSYDNSIKMWSPEGKQLLAIERKIEIPPVTEKINGVPVIFQGDDKLFRHKNGVVSQGLLAEDAVFNIGDTDYTFKKGSSLELHKNAMVQKGTLKKEVKVNIESKTYTLVKDKLIRFYDNGSFLYLSIKEDPKINGISFGTLKGFRGIHFHRSGKVFGGWVEEPVLIDGIMYRKDYMRFFETGKVSSGYPLQDVLIKGISFKGKKLLKFYKNGSMFSGTLMKNIRVKGIVYKEDTELRFHDNGNVSRGVLHKNIRFHGKTYIRGSEIYFHPNGLVSRGILKGNRVIYYNNRGRVMKKPMDRGY